MQATSFTQEFLSPQRIHEQIQKALYYSATLFQQLFPDPSLNTLLSAKYHKIIYYSAHYKASNQILTNNKIIQLCAHKTYLADFSLTKINEHLFKREVFVKLPYLFIFANSEEILGIHLLNHADNSSASILQQTKPQLFILHFCTTPDNNSVKWLHFVEHYNFSSTSFQYTLTAAIKQNKNFFDAHQKLFEQFLKTCKVLECPKRMQGFLLQEQINLKMEMKRSSDPAYSNEHRVINRISPENIKSYSILQKQFPMLDENLICRYLIAKQYNLAETQKSIKQYILWRQQITRQWKYQDFQEFHQQGIFYYIGQDHSGRPVILHRACKVLVNQFDLEKYSYFYIYYLEIYIPSLMRGNVSQIMIIADVENLGAANFKFSLTRRNMQDNLKYSPERQYKIIGVNVSSFAVYWWKLFSPLIPKRSKEKIVIAGSDRESIFEALQNEMPVQIIPEYLGGNNPIHINL